MAGIVNGLLNLGGDSAIYGVFEGFIFFIITYYLLKYIFGTIADPTKYVKTGIFSYFLLWFVAWTITWNMYLFFVMHGGP